MLSVELKTKTQHDINGISYEKKYAVINGIIDEDSPYSTHDGTSYLSFEDNSPTVEILLEHSFKDVGNYFSGFDYWKNLPEWKNSCRVDIYCVEFPRERMPKIIITLRIFDTDPEHWTHPWSMANLAKEFETNIINLGNPKLLYQQPNESSVVFGFGVEYNPDDFNLIIKKEVDFLLSTLSLSLDLTNKNFLASVDKDAILTYFQFPENIKTICKQYLIYFSQFIGDLGINVDIELKEELNNTLFKVTPKDKTEGLEKIREALQLYLNTPGDKDFEFSVADYNDISVKQWAANIYHLKSQLALANSIYQANQATIQSLELVNYQYRQLLESKDSKSSSSKEEDLIKGVIAVKKYEGKGFSIDFGEILRRLKRKLS